MPNTPTLDSVEQEMMKRRHSLLYEVWGFLAQNKKWWMIPILLVLLLFGMLMMLGSSAAAPFIYSLF